MTRPTAAPVRDDNPPSDEPRPVAVPDAGGKPLRADARRNREKVLAAAAAAFLEDVARRAGVGIGTLYRHFPTRDALVLGVYRQQIDDLDEVSRRLLAEREPGEALHEWMRAFVQYVAVKRGLVGLLKSLMGTDRDQFVATKATLHGAMARLLEAAAAAGAIRADVRSGDLIRAMGGVCMATDAAGGAASPIATTLVDLLYDGLRYGAGGRCGS
jgi:AcrR family transcriptional regulator